MFHLVNVEQILGRLIYLKQKTGSITNARVEMADDAVDGRVDGVDSRA
jgi:hypothetical protein